MDKHKLRSRPPGATRGEETFISGAAIETRTEPPQAVEESTEPNVPRGEGMSYPWQALGVREDVKKVFNLRLSEPYFLKLKYLSEQTRVKMQEICLEVLLPAIDAEVEKLMADYHRSEREGEG